MLSDHAILSGALLSLVTALPLAWKWRLGVVRIAAFVIVTALGFGALAWLLLPGSSGARVVAVWGLTLAASAAVLAYRFYRDPDRHVPEDDDVVVSPADGEVLYVRRSAGGRLPVATKAGHYYTLNELTGTPLRMDEAFVIGIGMSFLDVHVNRAPTAGRILFQRRVPGSFGSLRLPEMVFENERMTTVIERDGLQIAVVQIASRLVRRIGSFVRESQEVAAGERIGVIHFGSQVDLVLPANKLSVLLVSRGDRVRAGESILARLLRPAPRGTTDARQLTGQNIQRAG